MNDDSPSRSKRHRTREIVACAFGGVFLGAVLAVWMHGLDRVLPAGGIGLLVGLLCGTLDALVSRGMAWAVCRTQNRALVGIAGATINAGVMASFTLVLLLAVGWIGSCWG